MSNIQMFPFGSNSVIMPAVNFQLDKYIKMGLDFYQKPHLGQVKTDLAPSEIVEWLKQNLNSDSHQKFEDLIHFLLKNSVDTNNKHYSNQLWTNVRPPSVLAELLTAVTNTSMYTFEVAPVYSMMEHIMIGKLSDIVWGHKNGEGVITSGGTASNLQAMLLARNSIFSDVKELGVAGYGGESPVVIATDNAHYSVKRAANILGLGHQNLKEIKTNHKGQISASDLIDTINELKTDKKRPFMFISTAGSTVEGSFDNLQELGEVCRDNQLWFHIDGAYGGSAQFADIGPELMRGRELCDSFCWDFHKILGINLTCAFLLVKQKGHLKSALSSGNDGYLFHDDDEWDLGPKSLQCGRRPDILKLWLTWMELGEDGFKTRMNKMLQLTKQFAHLVDSHPRCQLLFNPQYLNVCFRVKGVDNALLRERLVKSGQLMVNFSENADGPYFRMVIGRDDLSQEDLEHYLRHILAHT